MVKVLRIIYTQGIRNNDICLRVLVEKNAIQFNIKNRFTLGFLKMIKIRPAVTSDIPQLVLLLEALFSIEADFLIDYDKQATGLELLINSSEDCVWVAEVGGIDQVVGMCSIQTMISTAEGGLVGVVEDLIVSVEYRQQGIATKLLSEAIRWAKEHGLKRLQLLADKNNVDALAFYHTQNWQKTQLIGLRYVGAELLLI